MKTKAGLLACLTSLAVAQVNGAEAIKPPFLGPRFKQTRERTEALFKDQATSNAAGELPTSLFRFSPPPTASVENTPQNEKPIVSDETILNEVLATLKKGGGGQMTRDGRTVVTFNQKVYKAGDSISVALPAGPVQVQVVMIARKTVTLGLNESQIMWAF